jgi:CHAT domain-containing protein
MKNDLVVGTRVLAGVILCALSTGCQPDQKPVVSLDQARQIQAGMQGQASFVAPPRTITDITAVLDQYKPDPAKLEEARKKADAEPPQGLAPLKLADFYYDRGQAAAEIGRRAQQLEDARRSVELATQAKHPFLNRMIAFEESAEAEMGNMRRRLELTRERVKTSQSPGQTLSSLIALSSALGTVGQLDEAKARMREAESFFSRPEFFSAPSLRTARPSFEFAIASTKSQLAAREGQTDEAVRLARLGVSKSIEANSEEGRRNNLANGVQEDYLDRLQIRAHNQLVNTLTTQGKTVEAEAEARKSLILSLKTFGRYSPVTAGAIGMLARVTYEQGRYDEADRLVDAAIDVYRSVGAGKGSVDLANALVLKGRVKEVKGHPLDALKIFVEAQALFPDDETLRFRYVEREPSFGAALLAAGEYQRAEVFFEKMVAINQAQFGPRNFLTAQARAYLAASLAKTNNRERALSEFAAAIPILLQTSRQIDDENGSADHDLRLQQVLEAYIDLLSTFRSGEVAGLDPAAEAFRMADAARARGVQRALAASAARASIRDADLAALVRQEQDAQKQIAALFGLLTNILSSPPQQQDADSTLQLRTRIDKLRDARAVLRKEIERRFPDYANLIDPRPATVADVQRVLQPGEALVSIYVGEARTYIWAVPRQGQAAFAAANLGEKDMARAVADLRKALDPNAATLGDIPAFDVAASHRLYQQLLQPVAAGLNGAGSLLVVPDKALGQLPFGLLVTQAVANPNDASGALFSGYKKVPFLIRQAAVTQLPSVTALATLRRVPAGNPSRKTFAGFGDPWFSPDQARQGQAEASTQVASLTTRGARGLQTRGLPLVRRNAPATAGVNSADLAMLPRLPDTADEVRSIADALKADQSDIFLGSAANETQVKTLNLADRKVVMFATHGLIPGDLNGLTQPALALTAPAVAQTEGDGLLTMDEILGLRLDADWIVLSACNTAAGDGAGAEAASGLGRAFFYAGTRAVLLTNWPVETTSARALTTDLFRRQAGDASLSRAKAMQQAMVGLIDGDGFVDQSAIVFSYAHPIFWAPFSVVGDGGGGNPGS